MAAGIEKSAQAQATVRPDYEPEYPFFTHEDCPHFPCHEDLSAADFNCAFCYCPLYALGPDCGGDYRVTKKGVKDCTPCSKPHRGRDGIRMVREKFPLLRDMVTACLAKAEECDSQNTEGAADAADAEGGGRA